ncbi:MAG: ATP-binding cassette domain-containing protein, partial [Clostridia bacterium]|nr:ATP-binding cassette domain-containing protein [Clostridia bacterium]
MQQPALKGINLSINEGEFILLLGESGSGKSTLGRVFNRIVPEFYGGKIGGEVEGLKDVGMVF